MDLPIAATRGAGAAGNLIALERPSSAATSAIRLLIAHEATLVRAGMRALLEHQPDLTVVGEVSRGEDAIAAAGESQPDVILMDNRIAGLDALEATRRIVAADGACASVVVLGTAHGGEELFGALHAGASGFLVRETTPVELLHAIRTAAEGHAGLSPCVTRRLIDEFASQPDPHRPVPERLEELTAREREVMGLAAMGLTNDEIGARLVGSPATAKTHISRAMLKLRARDRAQLVALAYQSRLVEPRRGNDDAPWRRALAA